MPTATRTFTLVPPTLTKTNTPIPPTLTNTNTQVTPTATNTLTPLNYYVSSTGSDQNPGSITQPWRTIQKAAKTVVGGNTVYIRGGTYNERVSLVNRYNTNGPYITFANYPGEEVILDGTGIGFQSSGGLFHIERTNYVRVSGLRVQHSNNNGIYVLYSNNIIVDNNHTYDTVKLGVGVCFS